MIIDNTFLHIQYLSTYYFTIGNKINIHIFYYSYKIILWETNSSNFYTPYIKS